MGANLSQFENDQNMEELPEPTRANENYSSYHSANANRGPGYKTCVHNNYPNDNFNYPDKANDKLAYFNGVCTKCKDYVLCMFANQMLGLPTQKQRKRKLPKKDACKLNNTWKTRSKSEKAPAKQTQNQKKL